MDIRYSANQRDVKRYTTQELRDEFLIQNLYAANEVVVAAFLRDEIGFLQMSDVIEQTMCKVSYINQPDYDDYVATDAEARRIAEELIW